MGVQISLYFATFPNFGAKNRNKAQVTSLIK